MSNDQYVKPPKKSVVKNTAGNMKKAYSYLHPNYWRRKWVEQIIVAPVVFLVYGIIYGVILMKLTGMNNDTMPWILTAADVVLISITTILCAYFYPFAYWWYKQSFTGTTLDNVIYIGSIWSIMLRKIGTALFGILVAGVMAPLTGPLALRRCRKMNIIIGEEIDFKR